MMARRPFYVFLLASIAAHAAVLAGMSLRARDGPPDLPVLLEVVILPAESASAPAAEPAPPPRSATRTARAPETAPPRAARKQPEPVLVPPPAPPAGAGSRAATSLDADAGRLDTPTPPAHERAREATAEAAPPRVSAAYLSNPRPRYPEAARRAGEQGTVMLRVLVTREGAAARVQVERSSGSAHLDHAALEAVRAWRFTPARQGGERIESWMLVPVVFRLEAAS